MSLFPEQQYEGRSNTRSVWPVVIYLSGRGERHRVKDIGVENLGVIYKRKFSTDGRETAVLVGDSMRAMCQAWRIQ